MHLDKCSLVKNKHTNKQTNERRYSLAPFFSNDAEEVLILFSLHQNVRIYMYHPVYYSGTNTISSVFGVYLLPEPQREM